jgi:hypothetical protein
VIREVLAVAVLAGSTIACGRTFAPSPDTLTTWQRMPIPPDPALAAKALDGMDCRPADFAFPIQIVLQDQRTPSTAAFLLAGGGMTGSCLISSGSGGGSGWTSAPLEAMTAPISIDEQGGGGGTEVKTTLLGGRIAPGTMRVEITLSDGSSMSASIGNGHWLAWWPGGLSAEKVTATPADGEVTVIEWRDGGWSVP